MRDKTRRTDARAVPVSHEAIRDRAGAWRARGLASVEADVAGVLDDAATVLCLVRAAVERLLAAVEEGPDARGDVAATRRELDGFDREDVQRFRHVGRGLRASDSDPLKGSTSALLEGASDEIGHVLDGLDRMVALAERGAAMDLVRDAALRALRRPPARTTRGAPSMTT